MTRDEFLRKYGNGRNGGTSSAETQTAADKRNRDQKEGRAERLTEAEARRASFLQKYGTPQAKQPVFDPDKYVNAVYNMYSTPGKITGSIPFFGSGSAQNPSQKPAADTQADLKLLRDSGGAHAVTLSDGTVVMPKDVDRYIFNLEHNQAGQQQSVQKTGGFADPLSAYLGAYRNRNASAEERMDVVSKNLSDSSWAGLTNGSRQAETDLNWLIEDAEKQLASMKQTDPKYSETQARIIQLRQLKNVYQARREYAGSFTGEEDYLNAQTALRGVDMYHQAGKTAEDYYGQATGDMNAAQQRYKQAEADYNAAQARLDELSNLASSVDYSSDRNGVLTLPDGRVIRGQEAINNYIAKQAAEIKADIQTKDDALQAAAAEYKQAESIHGYAKAYQYSDITDRQDYQQGLAAGKAKYQQLQQKVEVQRAAEETEANAGNVETAGYNRHDDYYTFRMPEGNWTASEMDTYCYLLNEDESKAENYAIEVNFRNRLRTRAKEQERFSDWSYEHPFWGGLAGTASKVATSPTGLWDYFGDLAQYGNTGLVMPRSELSMRDYANAIESGAAQRYNEVGVLPEDLAVLGGKGLGDLYMLGNSVAESLAWGKMGQGMLNAGASEKMVSATINIGFFGNAASETTQQALARGATPEQALGIGALAGAAEALGETMSIENLIHMSDPVGARQILLNILTQAGIEGSEEGVTTLINTWSEALVYGDKSDLNQAYLNNLASGMSRDEAKKAAWTEWAENLAFDVFGGMLSGGISATGNMVLSPAARKGASNAWASATKYKGDTQGLMERAMTAGGEAANLAAKYKTRGKGLSNRQAAKLDQATWESIKSEDRDALIGDVKKQILSRATGVFSDVQAQNSAERIVDAVLEGKAELPGSPTEMERQTFQQLQEQLSGEKTDWLNTKDLKMTQVREQAKARADESARTVETKTEGKGEVTRAVMTDDGMKMEVKTENGTKQYSQADLNLSEGQQLSLSVLSQILGNDAAAAYNGMSYGQIDFENPLATIAYANAWASVRDRLSGKSEEEMLQSPLRKGLTDTQAIQAWKAGQNRGEAKTETREKAKKGTGRIGLNGAVLNGGKDSNGNDVKIKLQGVKNPENFEKHKRYQVLKALCEAMHIDCVIFDSSRSEGKGKSMNGAYIDGVIYLDWVVMSKKSGKYFTSTDMMFRAMSHELTHFIQQQAPQEYAQLKSFVTDYLAEKMGEDYNDLVTEKMWREYDEKTKYTLSRERAEDEVVADACETMLRDSEYVQKMFEENRSLFDKISGWVNKFLRQIEAHDIAAKELRPVIDELRRLWDAGLRAAVDGTSAETKQAATQDETKTETSAETEAATQTVAEEKRSETFKETVAAEETAKKEQTRRPFTPNDSAHQKEASKKFEAEHKSGIEAVREQKDYLKGLIGAAAKRLGVGTVDGAMDYADNVAYELAGVYKPLFDENGDFLEYDYVVNAVGTEYGISFAVDSGERFAKEHPDEAAIIRRTIERDIGAELRKAAAADAAARPSVQMSTRQAQNALAKLDESSQEIVKSLGKDATMAVNKQGEMLLAESQDGHSVAFSMKTYDEGGKDKLIQALKENGHTQEEIDAVIESIEATGDFLEKLAQQYADEYDYQNLKKNLWADITTNLKTGKQVLSALVNNGDYPVNFDLQLICKKRVAYMRMLTRLIDDGVFEKVDFKGAAIADLNMILRDGGFETACLGCFVESRRLQLQAWAESIVREWNEEVDKRNPEAGSFDFAKGGKTLSQMEIAGLITELENAGKKNDKGNLNLSTGAVKEKMGRLLDKVKSLQQHLTVADLLTPQGMSTLRGYDQNLFSLVKQRYGANSPKIVQDFNPYNGEIADLSFKFVKQMIGESVSGSGKYTSQVKKEMPQKKGESKAEYNRRVETEAMRRYLYDIGGARIQSFSDFMIENVFDYMQIIADLSARKFPLHGYSKEAIFLRLFGMTGGKFNGSWIAHVDKSMGKEYAGLLPVEEASNGRGIVVEVDGEKYAICMDDYARHAATGSFIQSIGMKDMVALQMDPRYSKNVGSITIGVSNKQILAMLDSPYFRMVIPYHASGMIPEFAKLVGVNNYNDYTDYQTTKVNKCFDLKGNPVEGFWKADGKKVEIDTHFDFNEAVQRLGDARAAAQEYLDWCKQRHPVYDGKKLVGYATYQAKFSDSPYGTDFTQHENYYKLLEDFNSYDSIGEASALQGAVTMTLPSEANRLTPEQMTAYKQALRDTGLYTEKEIQKYAKKADMTFQELIAEEVGNRAEYESRQAKVWDETVDKAEQMLLEKYSRDSGRAQLSVRETEDASKKAASEGGRVQLSTKEKTIIVDAVDKAIKTKGSLGTPGNRVTVTDVPADFAEYVLAASDGAIDISKKKIALHGSELWHEYKRHALEKKKEKDRDQIPFTKRRYVNAINAIFNPDYVECVTFDTNNRSQQQSFLYAKRTQIGDYIVVVAVSGTGNGKSDVYPIEIIHVNKNKWNYWMRNGGTIVEMLYSSDLNMQNSIDVQRTKKNRVSVAQFARKRAIANTPHVSQFVNSIDQEVAKVNSEGQKSVKSDAKTDRELLKAAYQDMLKQKQQAIEGLQAEQKKALEDFRKAVDRYEAKEREVTQALRELDRLVQAGDNHAAVSEQRQKVTAAESRMTTALKNLASLQERPALQQILQQERQIERQRTRDRIRESANRRDLRGKIDRLWKDLNRRITSPTEKKHIPVDVMQQAIEVLEALNMDTGREGSMAGERLRSKLLELKQRYEALKNDKDYSMAARYDEFVSEMLGNMIEKVGDTPINKMSVEQMESVYETLKALDHVIKTKTKIQLGERMAEIREVGQKMIDETRSIDKAKKGWLQAYLNTQLSPERMFNRLGGYHKNSVWNQLYRMLDSGQLKQTQLEMEGSLIFDDLINSKEHARDYKDFVDPSRTVDVGLKDRSGNAVKLTHGMMVSLWMHLQNEQNRRHVAYGGLTIPGLKDYYGGKKAAAAESGVRVGGVLQQIDEINQQIEQEEDPDKILDLEEKRDTISEDFTQDLLDAIEKNLTEYDRAWITACREMFDNFSKRVLNETTMQVYGIKRANVENYFPLSVDKHFLQANFDTIVRDFNLENAGFMKERVESRKPVHLFDVSDVAAQQVRRVSQYAGLMPAIRAFNQVLGYTSQSMDSVQSAIFDKFGNSGMDYIENLMADLNGARGQKETGLGAFLNRLRGHMAQSALTLSLRTAMAQAASYPTAASVVGWKALHKALWHGGRNGWLLSKADKDLIQKWSPLLYYRMKGYSSVALGDIAGMNDRWSRVWKKARWLTGWIQAMDGATVGRLWYAAEFYVQDKNKDLKKGTDAYYEEVAKVFNDIVEKTQPNYTTMQRPDILRNPNALVKQLTMFMTQRLQNFNIMVDAAATYSTMMADFKAGRNGVTLEDVRQAGIQSRRAFVSQAVAAMTIVVFKALADIIQHSLHAYRDDDDEELKAESISLELLDMFIDTLAGNVLGGGEAWDIAERLIPIFNKNYYGIEVSGIGAVNDFTDSLINLYSKAVKDDGKPEWKDYDKVIKNLCTLAGIPWSNGEKFVKAGWYWIQDAKNGEFFRFEAGVDRTMAQQATRLYRAYTETDGAKVQKVLSEVPEDKQKDLYTAVRKLIKKRQESGEITVYEAMRQMQKYGGASEQVMTNYIKEIYADGKLPKADMEKYLVQYGGKTEEAAAKTATNASAKQATGVNYNDIDDLYKIGTMTADDARKALVEYGIDKDTADMKVEYWNYQQQNPGTSMTTEDRFETYWKKYRPIGMTPKVYDDFRVRWDAVQGTDKNNDGKADSGSKKAERLLIIDSLPLTDEQKDELFLMNWSSAGLKDAPWHK